MGRVMELDDVITRVESRAIAPLASTPGLCEQPRLRDVITPVESRLITPSEAVKLAEWQNPTRRQGTPTEIRQVSFGSGSGSKSAKDDESEGGSGGWSGGWGGGWSRRGSDGGSNAGSGRVGVHADENTYENTNERINRHRKDSGSETSGSSHRRLPKAQVFVKRDGGNLLEDMRRRATTESESTRKVVMVKEMSKVVARRAELRENALGKLGNNQEGWKRRGRRPDGFLDRGLIEEVAEEYGKALRQKIEKKRDGDREGRPLERPKGAVRKAFARGGGQSLETKHVSMARDDWVDFITLSKSSAPRKRDCVLFWRTRKRTGKSDHCRSEAPAWSLSGSLGALLGFNTKRRKRGFFF